MGIVVFLSLDLAWDITGHHHGHSAGLFFLSLVFPAVAVLLYLVLSCIVVCRKLEVYSSLSKSMITKRVHNKQQNEAFTRSSFFSGTLKNTMHEQELTFSAFSPIARTDLTLT